jgi:hypothetical protein
LEYNEDTVYKWAQLTFCKSVPMFHSHNELAAVVYDDDHKPDEILHAFADDLRTLRYRVAGLVQLAGHCSDGQLAVTLLHTGERLPLLGDRVPGTTGCRLEVERLLDAGNKVIAGIDAGADIVIVNRFGKQERDGKGLRFVIEHAINADIPVLVAVSQSKFPEWIAFSEGMSVKLPCDRDVLNSWWNIISGRASLPVRPPAATVCELGK